MTPNIERENEAIDASKVKVKTQNRFHDRFGSSGFLLAIQFPL